MIRKESNSRPCYCQAVGSPPFTTKHLSFSTLLGFALRKVTNAQFIKKILFWLVVSATISRMQACRLPGFENKAQRQNKSNGCLTDGILKKMSSV